MEYRKIKVEFSSELQEKERKEIYSELIKCFDYIFNESEHELCNLKRIIFRRKSDNDNVFYGVYHKDKEEVEILVSKENIVKLKNTICHELVHVKFFNDICSKAKDLMVDSWIAYLPLALIDEYNARKISNSYCYDIEELKDIENIDFNFCFKNRGKCSKEEQTNLIGLICEVMIAYDLLNGKGYNVDNLINYNNRLYNLKAILQSINFIPTKEEYSRLIEVLKKEGFKFIPNNDEYMRMKELVERNRPETF